MTKNKTMIIAFLNGGIIPASEVRPPKKENEDTPVSSGEEVLVSASYGQQMVDDKFAYEVIKSAGKTKKDKSTKKAKADEKARLKAISDAKVEVSDAEEALASAENDNDKVAAQQLLDGAKTKLQKLSAE